MCRKRCEIERVTYFRYSALYKCAYYYYYYLMGNHT